VLPFSLASSSHVLLAVMALQAPPATTPVATGDQTILWFRSSDAATVDGRALLDAVAVYTRDLGLTVKAAADAVAVPADVPAAGAVAATLKAQGARLGFWCELRPNAELATLTVVATDGHLELHLVERTGANEAELYRAIGLKLRSVLTGTATPEPVAVRPPPTAPPPTPVDAGLRAAPAAPPPATATRRPFVSIGYRLSTPVDSAAARHALAIDGALAIGPWLEAHAGTELAPRLEQQVGSDVLSIFDWPIFAGARVVRHGARFSYGGGLFGALHLLWASATPSAGAAESSFAAAGGAGAELLARARLAGALAGELRLYAEVPLPTTHYSLRGVAATDVGARAGIGLGLAFPAP
jgi:hypothetical protein